MGIHLIGVRAQPRSTKPQSHWTNANLTRLHYVEWSQRGTPILLIHGLYDDVTVWRNPKVTIPTLLVMGIPVLPPGMDAAPLKEARQQVEQVAQQKLGQGKAVFIERAQHWIQNDQPRALAQAINAFLTEAKQ
jgi:pimeloyl-ACP methyl ester carboxylesterase